MVLPVVLNDFQRHIVMYAKGCYKKKKTIGDIKKIIAYVSGVPESSLDVETVYQHVVSTFRALGRNNPLLENLFWNEFFRGRIYELNISEMIRRLLIFINGFRIISYYGDILIEVGDPNYFIIPRSNPNRF